MAEKSALSRQDVERLWYAVPPDEVVRALDTDRAQGLSAREVERRREAFGENKLPEKRETAFQTFLRQFKDPLIYIFLIAGAVSLAIGNFEDAGFTFAVLLFNAGLGTYQEYKAESAAEALKQVMKITAKVTRGGERREVDSREQVPGDLVAVQSGSSVADIRLLRAQDLRATSRCSRTVPVEKRAGAALDF